MHLHVLGMGYMQVRQHLDQNHADLEPCGLHGYTRPVAVMHVYRAEHSYQDRCDNLVHTMPWPYVEYDGVQVGWVHCNGKVSGQLVDDGKQHDWNGHQAGDRQNSPGLCELPGDRSLTILKAASVLNAASYSAFLNQKGAFFGRPPSSKTKPMPEYRHGLLHFEFYFLNSGKR